MIYYLPLVLLFLSSNPYGGYDYTDSVTYQSYLPSNVVELLNDDTYYVENVINVSGYLSYSNIDSYTFRVNTISIDCTVYTIQDGDIVNYGIYNEEYTISYSDTFYGYEILSSLTVDSGFVGNTYSLGIRSNYFEESQFITFNLPTNVYASEDIVIQFESEYMENEINTRIMSRTNTPTLDIDSIYSEGYSEGYSQGFNEGASMDTTAVTIFNGILNIALVPVNFFLAMFNFEILGINISSLVSALLSVCMVIIVIRMITGKKNGD